MITENSRYQKANVRTVDTDRGLVQAVYQPARFFSGQNYATYLSVEGDTFDLLAHRLYGEALNWWRIAEANPHVFNPGPIPPGVVLRIPA